MKRNTWREREGEMEREKEGEREDYPAHSALPAGNSAPGVEQKKSFFPRRPLPMMPNTNSEKDCAHALHFRYTS